jgi:drug/metabolite transporter (DMT)-like permease
MNPHRAKAYSYLLFVTLIWGAASVVIKLTLNGFNPLTFLTYRFFISTVIAFTALKGIKKLFTDKKVLIASVIYSLFSTSIALGFLFLGLEKTTVLNLSLITLISPLLIEFAGVHFLNEHLTKKEKIGSLIAFAGTILTILEPIIESRANVGSFEGNLLILLYMGADIASVIILKKLLRDHISPTALANFSFVIGFVSILPIALLQIGFINFITTLSDTPIYYHLGVWYMAIVSGTIAYALRNRAQKTIEVGEAALFAYLTSLVSVPLAVLILSEKITLLYTFGGIIIVFGVFIAEYKPRQKQG